MSSYLIFEWLKIDWYNDWNWWTHAWVGYWIYSSWWAYKTFNKLRLFNFNKSWIYVFHTEWAILNTYSYNNTWYGIESRASYLYLSNIISFNNWYSWISLWEVNTWNSIVNTISFNNWNSGVQSYKTEAVLLDNFYSYNNWIYWVEYTFTKWSYLNNLNIFNNSSNSFYQNYVYSWKDYLYFWNNNLYLNSSNTMASNTVWTGWLYGWSDWVLNTVWIFDISNIIVPSVSWWDSSIKGRQLVSFNWDEIFTIWTSIPQQVQWKKYVYWWSPLYINLWVDGLHYNSIKQIWEY